MDEENKNLEQIENTAEAVAEEAAEAAEKTAEAVAEEAAEAAEKVEAEEKAAEPERISFDGEPANTEALAVSTEIDREGVKSLVEVCYENAKDTLKKDGKIDPVVFFCGLFAIGCLGVSIYNAVKNGFDVVIGLLMAAYVLIAVICLTKPLQRALGKMLFGWGLNRRFKLNTKGNTAVFDEKAISFSEGEKERVVYYDSMWTGYETDNFYVFHIADNQIVPVSKENVKKAASTYKGREIADFFKELISKADGTAPEEEIPQITR